MVATLRAVAAEALPPNQTGGPPAWRGAGEQTILVNVTVSDANEAGPPRQSARATHAFALTCFVLDTSVA